MSDYVPLKPITRPDEPALPPEQAFQPPPPKKSNVMVWVLAGCMIAVYLGAYYAWKAYYPGLDPEPLQKSPALALGKWIVAAHPDVLELVSVDEEQRLITLRNKKTGETSTVPINSTESGDAIYGSFVFAIPADNEFFIGRDKVAQADTPTRIRNILKDKHADERVVYIKSGKEVKYGTVVSVIDSIREAGFDRIGVVAEKEDGVGSAPPESSPKLPGWFPSYPGAVVHGATSTESKDGESSSFGFSTNDSIDKVVKFYEETLKQAGLKVTANTVRQKGVVSKGSIATEDADKKRTALVTAVTEKSQTQVTVVFASK